MKNKLVVRRLKQVLERRRAALLRTLKNDLAELQGGSGHEPGDVAEVALDDTFELVSSQLAETESRELVQIETALERIRRGTFGQCSGCGHDIPVARLEALPYAARCVKCEREAEQRRGAGTTGSRWGALSASEDEGEPNNPFLDHVADIF